MAEQTTYVGDVTNPTDILNRGSYQTLTSNQKISKIVQWAVFNNSPFLKAVGIEAWGVEGMKSLEAFGRVGAPNRMLRMDSGVHSIAGQIFSTTGTSFHVGRLGNFNPELIEGGEQWAYSWHRLINTQFIPDVDVQDNTNGHIDIKTQKMSGMKQQYAEDVNLGFLGNSSAPDSGTLGPKAVKSSIDEMISVDQLATIGGIAKTNSFWQNGFKSLAGGIGGGGEMDRPILLRRAFMDELNDRQVFAESTGTHDYLHLATQGAWQYYDRLMYADSVQASNSGAFGNLRNYDAAGIPHFAFAGSPLIWDNGVTIPVGATASTESIYMIHVPTFFIGLRNEENFLVSDWELPREHDTQKTLVASIKTRYTPGITAARAHSVLHSIPANAD